MSLARRLVTVVLFCATIGQPALAQQRASPEAVDTARALIEATGAAAQFDQALPLLIGPLTKAFIALAPGRAGEIRELMAEMVKRCSARKSELINEVAGIYAQKMSIEDMREIAKFYQSEVGRRMVAAQPEIMRQSILAGQTWGQRIGAEIDAEMRRELKKRGIDL
jgi:uncharacterized protein